MKKRAAETQRTIENERARDERRDDVTERLFIGGSLDGELHEVDGTPMRLTVCDTRAYALVTDLSSSPRRGAFEPAPRTCHYDRRSVRVSGSAPVHIYALDNMDDDEVVEGLWRLSSMWATARFPERRTT